MDVGKAIEPAFKHMIEMLFKPFVLRMWLALGFISIFAGGSGSGRFPNPSDFGNAGSDIGDWLREYWVFVVLGFLVLLLIGIFFTWLSSVLRFVYVDDITRKSGAVAEPFGRLVGLGTSYFLWQLAFGFAVLLAMGILIGLPFVAAFAMKAAGEAMMAVAVIWAILVFIPLMILTCIIEIFAHDFVIPAMYVRRVGVIEGWRTILPILKANTGQTVLYLLMLIALGIAIGIFGLLVFFISAVIFAIPVGLFAGIGYLIWMAAGLTWNPLTIAVAVTFGVIVFLAFIYFIECAVQPAMIFRRAFALVVLGQADPSLATVTPADR
jgi:hypothetical protein